MTLPIFTLPRVPGAAETHRWESFCHTRTAFVVLGFSDTRDTSRWQAAERKKKYSVTLYRRSRVGGFYKYVEHYYTLERAQREAARIAKQEHGR